MNSHTLTKTTAIMTVRELKIHYAEICNSLSARRLKPAFDMLGKLISENGLGIYSDECRKLEETYHYMLKYTVEGVSDPERRKVYRKLIVSAFELADKVNETLQIKYSPSPEYEKKRAYGNSLIINPADCLAELDAYYQPADKKHTFGKTKSKGDKGQSTGNEESPAESDREQHHRIQKVFYHIWFNDKLSSEEADIWRTFLQNPVIPVPYKSLITTAIMLGLQRFFDAEKFVILSEACSSPEMAVNQRALVGLLINLYKYDPRIEFYPDLTGRLKILNETPAFRRNLEKIISQFIASKETEKLQQRIRDEILPEMIKISPNLKDKINLDSLMEEFVGRQES